MVDLTSEREISDSGDVEPRTLEWRGLLRRAFSSKKKKRKKLVDTPIQLSPLSSPKLFLTRPDGFTRKVKDDDVNGSGNKERKVTSRRRMTSPTKRRVGLSKSNPLTVEQQDQVYL